MKWIIIDGKKDFNMKHNGKFISMVGLHKKETFHWIQFNIFEKNRINLIVFPDFLEFEENMPPRTTVEGVFGNKYYDVSS